MKRVLTVLALVGALGGAGVLGGCGGQQSAAPGGTPANPAAPSDGADGSDASPAPDALQARVIAVTVRGGEISGDTGRVQVPLGTPVTVRVTSDAADELHVHGYDKEAEIPPGGTAQLSFTADIPGVFEVELHESEQQLFSLQVG